MDSELSMLIGVVLAVIIVLPLGMFMYRKSPTYKNKQKMKSYFEKKLFEDLKVNGKSTVPQILERAGVSDGLISRGVALSELGKLTHVKKQLVEELPKDCPVKERIERITYRLP